MRMRMHRGTPAAVLLLFVAIVATPKTDAQSANPTRPMSFLDVQHLRTVGYPAMSADGERLLYTLSTMDWKEARRQTDLYLVSTKEGVDSTRQLTFTRDKQETSPRWSKDGRFFVFLSNRDAPENTSSRNQLYLMRPDGGEARRITDAREGVTEFNFSKDGEWIAYRSGRSGDEQLYRLSTRDLDAPPEQITKHPTGISAWRWAPDTQRI